MINLKLSPNRILQTNQLTGHVFNRYNICTKTTTPISQIPKKHFLDYSFFVDLLNSYDNVNESKTEKFMVYEIPVIIDYLVKSHHYYLSSRLPLIEQNICIQINKFEKKHPLIYIFYEFILFYKRDLKEHFKEEEEFLFPFANSLYEFAKNNSTNELENIKKLKIKALAFIEKHQNEPSELSSLNDAFLKYKSKESNPTVFKGILNQLNDFQKDLNIHAQIEDNILIKKINNLLIRIK